VQVRATENIAAAVEALREKKGKRGVKSRMKC
jgi:hypothetical protein